MFVVCVCVCDVGTYVCLRDVKNFISQYRSHFYHKLYCENKYHMILLSEKIASLNITSTKKIYGSKFIQQMCASIKFLPGYDMHLWSKIPYHCYEDTYSLGNTFVIYLVIL